MQNWLSKKYLLFLFLLVSPICLGSHSVTSEESEAVDWEIKVLYAYIHDLDVNTRQVDFQWYFSFNVNSSFEVKVVYIPEKKSPYAYYGTKTGGGNWYESKIDRPEADLDVSHQKQFWYPFDEYVMKILVGFNVSLKTESFDEKMSKANFEIKNKAIESFWVLKNNTRILDTVPDEYSDLLEDSNKTIFQFEITLARECHQQLIPFCLYWILPIIISSFFTISLIKREHELKVPHVLGSVFSPIAILILLLINIKGEKPPCITLAEGIIVFSIFIVILCPVFSLARWGRSYRFGYIEKLLTNAVGKWGKDKFEAFYRTIEFDKLNKEQISKLKNLLCRWKYEANKKKDKEKVRRIDKILDLYIFR